MSYPYGTRKEHRVPAGPLSSALDRSTTFAMPTAEDIRAHGVGERHGDFYPRLGHGNGREFESRVANLEQTDGAVAFGSGMAAIHAAILAHCGNGDRVLIADHVYGGTDNLARDDLPRFGIQVERFDALDPESLAQALSTPARMVVLETPINPTLRLVDLRQAVKTCRQHDALLLVDATFAPPPIQQTASFGVDLTVHSATKYLGGHSDVLAGVVAGTHEVLAPVAAFRTHTGGVLGPDAAWLLCRSMPTLALRLKAQQATAGEVAQGLLASLAAGAPLLSVSYPGLPEHPDHALMREQMSGGGCLVTFEVAGGLARAEAVFNALRVVAKAPSLGAVESLASLPCFTTHAAVPPEDRVRAGIGDGMIRVSVGLEAADRILGDLDQALKA
ncbi:MAG: trans-sulfuration enzyme family protein [Planctomycetota bacterium]|jgi:cystathionine beta-lyase/cystathionine gamma-synthase